MTLAQVANELLLSKRHVQALEAEDPGAFYNHTFYQQAQRRYASLLGFAVAPVAETAGPEVAVVEPLPLAKPPTLADMPAGLGATRAGPAEKKGRGLRTALLVVLMLATALLVWRGETLVDGVLGMMERGPAAAPQEPSTGTSTEPVEAAEAAPTTGQDYGTAQESVEVPKAAAVANALASIDSTSGGEIESVGIVPVGEAVYLFDAHRLCWIFAREVSGKETQVTLKAGQRLALPGQLSYLAVGDVSAARVWVDGSERDLSGFSSNGRVARLGPAELRLLRNGANAATTPPTD